MQKRGQRHERRAKRGMHAATTRPVTTTRCEKAVLAVTWVGASDRASLLAWGNANPCEADGVAIVETLHMLGRGMAGTTVFMAAMIWPQVAAVSAVKLQAAVRALVLRIDSNRTHTHTCTLTRIRTRTRTMARIAVPL